MYSAKVGGRMGQVCHTFSKILISRFYASRGVCCRAYFWRESKESEVSRPLHSSLKYPAIETETVRAVRSKAQSQSRLIHF